MKKLKKVKTVKNMRNKIELADWQLRALLAAILMIGDEAYWTWAVDRVEDIMVEYQP